MTEVERIEQFKLIMKPCIPHIIHWETISDLVNMDFFSAPASMHHHGTYCGALYDHSFTVMKVLLSFTKRLELKWERKESPYIVGMLHDLCKVDNYKVKSSEWGKDVKDDSWEYNNASLLPGHGDKSVIMIQQLGIRLTEEEMLCIRWHMGAFDSKDNWNSYGRSVTKYPNVLYTHTADMVAARILGV